MNNFSLFRLRDATFVLTLLCVTSGIAPAFAQDGPGNKPEMIGEMHAGKPKILSTTLEVALGDKILVFTPTVLAALPHETAAVINGHTKASESYSGVPIAAILARLGLPFEKMNEHTLLKTYVVAEGTDGYKIILSSYECLAALRGTSVIVADSLGGKALEQDGAFKLVIPGDARPQRWVQNLKSLTFKTID